MIFVCVEMFSTSNSPVLIYNMVFIGYYPHLDTFTSYTINVKLTNNCTLWKILHKETSAEICHYTVISITVMCSQRSQVQPSWKLYAKQATGSGWWLGQYLIWHFYKSNSDNERLVCHHNTGISMYSKYMTNQVPTTLTNLKVLHRACRIPKWWKNIEKPVLLPGYFYRTQSKALNFRI